MSVLGNPYLLLNGYRDQNSCAKDCEVQVPSNGCTTAVCFCRPENFIVGLNAVHACILEDCAHINTTDAAESARVLAHDYCTQNERPLETELYPTASGAPEGATPAPTTGGAATGGGGSASLGTAETASGAATGTAAVEVTATVTAEAGGGGLTVGQGVGIGVGVAAAVGVAAGLAFFFWRRRRNARAVTGVAAAPGGDAGVKGNPYYVPPVPEIQGQEWRGAELDSGAKRAAEMPGQRY